MKKTFFVITLIVLAGLFLAGCGTTNTEEDNTAQVIQPSFLIAEGRVLPLVSMELSFKISGQISEVLVNDGDVVSAGQVLARIDVSPEAKAVVTRAEQEYLSAQQAMNLLERNANVQLTQSRVKVFELVEAQDQAQTRYDNDTTEENMALLDAVNASLAAAEENLSRLEGGKGIDPDQLAAAESRLVTAEASLESARALLKSFELTSSLDGSVIDLTLQPGEMVTAGVPVMVIADISGWQLKTDNLTELEVAEIEVGQPVEVFLDALPDVQLSGKVVHINTRYEEKRGDTTYTATIELAQIDPRMRWGMTASIKFGK